MLRYRVCQISTKGRHNLDSQGSAVVLSVASLLQGTTFLDVSTSGSSTEINDWSDTANSEFADCATPPWNSMTTS